MSFIIKGFDTDGNCLHCYFQSEDSDRCILTDDDIPLYGKGHPDSCPLIPLPEGHGRLIDAGVFEDYVQNEWELNELSNGDWVRFREWLRDQPSIVPAETDE